VEFLFFEIRIKRHCKIADENSSKPGGSNFVFSKKNEAVGLWYFEALKLRIEVRIKIYSKLSVDFLFRNYCVAEQATDNGAPNVIVIREMITTHRGKATVMNGGLPGA